jgi:hypothetical protein
VGKGAKEVRREDRGNGGDGEDRGDERDGGNEENGRGNGNRGNWGKSRRTNRVKAKTKIRAENFITKMLPTD